MPNRKTVVVQAPAAAAAEPTKSPSRRRQSPPGSLTISVAEAAAMLGLGLNQTYGAAERGDIPSIRIGGRILVPRAPFERLFAGG